MNILREIVEEAKAFFEGANACHNWDHTERVYNLALRIGGKENADLEVLKIAAILHDIGRKHEDESKGKICHAEKSTELAKELLLKTMRN